MIENVFFLVLMFVTGAYMVVCMATDLKERMIYSFWCLPIAGIWWITALIRSGNAWSICLIMVLHFLLYFLFREKEIWADGDNLLFLVFGAVFSGCFCKAYDTALPFAAVELTFLSGSLLAALLIGLLESVKKGTHLQKSSSIAVAPGFCLGVLSMMTCFSVERWF